MITFENKLFKYNSNITISDLGEGSFFERDRNIYQLLYWQKTKDGETYWHCMCINSGLMNDFYADVNVIPINVTITATSYCTKE